MEKPKLVEWAPLIAVALSILALLWNAAQAASRIDEQDRRITRIETQMEAVVRIDIRTARIEERMNMAQAR